MQRIVGLGGLQHRQNNFLGIQRHPPPLPHQGEKHEGKNKDGKDDDDDDRDDDDEKRRKKKTRTVFSRSQVNICNLGEHLCTCLTSIIRACLHGLENAASQQEILPHSAPSWILS